ncbi:hypothetical protein HYU50_02180 [Candidatus Woesearchaeota archaeon]|nr:hypothetical protein [Candidatus Woesearchaeota archaeon]
MNMMETWMEKIGGLGIFTSPRNFKISTIDDRVLATFDNGFELGSIFDTKGYKESIDMFGPWLSEPQLEISRKFEEYTQELFKKLGPRRYSGLPSYSHVLDNASIGFENSKAAQIPLDFIIMLDKIGHDNIEIHENIMDLLNQYETELIQGRLDKAAEIGRKLRAERISLKGNIDGRLLRYLMETRTKGSEKEALRRDIVSATKIIYDLTRFSDAWPYPLSMGIQFGRKRNEDLGLTFRRTPVKFDDRTCNVMEYKRQPLLARQIERAYNGGDAGRKLREIYGDVNARAVEMPAAIKVQTAFKSLFPLHYMNETMNEYGADINNGKYGDRTKQLFWLAMQSKKRVVEKTLGLLESAVKFYEGGNIPEGVKEAIDRDIKHKRKTSYFDKVTDDGFVEPWIVYDVAGRGYIEALDRSQDRRVVPYRAARELQVLIPMSNHIFDKDSRMHISSGDYDPKKHDFYTLKLVPQTLASVKHDYLDLVSRLKFQTETEKISGSRLPLLLL